MDADGYSVYVDPGVLEHMHMNIGSFPETPYEYALFGELGLDEAFISYAAPFLGEIETPSSLRMRHGNFSRFQAYQRATSGNYRILGRAVEKKGSRIALSASDDDDIESLMELHGIDDWIEIVNGVSRSSHPASGGRRIGESWKRPPKARPRDDWIHYVRMSMSRGERIDDVVIRTRAYHFDFTERGERGIRKERVPIISF